MNTFQYKIGYIHVNFHNNDVRVQIGYEVFPVNSVHAGKLFITKHMKGLKRA